VDAASAVGEHRRRHADDLTLGEDLAEALKPGLVVGAAGGGHDQRAVGLIRVDVGHRQVLAADVGRRAPVHLKDLKGPALRVSRLVEHAAVLAEVLEVDVPGLVHHVQDHAAGRDEVADAVDVPVGVGGLGAAGLEPDDLLDPEEVTEDLLLPFAREVRVARRVQQAALGGDERPFAVDAEGAALEDHGRCEALPAEVLAEQSGDLRVLVVGKVLLAPRVEGEVGDRSPAVRAEHEVRSVVADPRVVDG